MRVCLNDGRYEEEIRASKWWGKGGKSLVCQDVEVQAESPGPQWVRISWFFSNKLHLQTGAQWRIWKNSTNSLAKARYPARGGASLFRTAWTPGVTHRQAQVDRIATEHRQKGWQMPVSTRQVCAP